MLSGIDRVDSKLIDCIKMAESKTRSRIREEKPAGNPKRQTPGLFGWDRLPLGNSRFLHRNLLTSGLLNQLIFPIPYSIRISTSSWKVLTTSNHSTISRIGQTTSTLFMGAMAHPPQMADALWELVKLKKGKSKAPEQSSKSIFDKS